jgi:RNA polymerase sigma factor (TIGR02999 family)
VNLALASAELGQLDPIWEQAVVLDGVKQPPILATMPDRTAQARHCLQELSAGNRDAAHRFNTILYQELQEIASGYLRREASGHTLQPTALVHEAFLRLINYPVGEDQTHTQFRALAANVLRNVLVDHARARLTQRRGGKDHRRVTLSTDLRSTEGSLVDLLALEDALQKLAAVDERSARVVELRFFAGLTLDEVGKVLGVSKKTVKLDWKTARAWLLDRLGSESEDG